MFISDLNQSLINKVPFDGDKFENKVKDWERSWVNQDDSYSGKVTGNSVDGAMLISKNIIQSLNSIITMLNNVKITKRQNFNMPFSKIIKYDQSFA